MSGGNWIPPSDVEGWLSRLHHDHGDKLDQIIRQQEVIMSSLANLQAADAALKAEVSTFLADVAARLSGDDPDVDAVVADINSQVAAMQAADPAAAPAPAEPAAPADPAAPAS